MIIHYKFKSWNEIIGECRTHFHLANKTKQEETMLVKMKYLKEKPIERYPIGIIFTWHIKNSRRDIDGCCPKNILDGMVKAGYIKDDNVKYINKLVHEYIEDTEDYVEIEVINHF